MEIDDTDENDADAVFQRPYLKWWKRYISELCWVAQSIPSLLYLVPSLNAQIVSHPISISNSNTCCISTRLEYDQVTSHANLNFCSNACCMSTRLYYAQIVSHHNCNACCISTQNMHNLCPDQNSNNVVLVLFWNMSKLYPNPKFYSNILISFCIGTTLEYAQIVSHPNPK